MSLLDNYNSISLQNWPLEAKINLFETISKLSDNSRCFGEEDIESCLQNSLHHLEKRSKPKNDPKMPVVFIPKKSKTECERSSRMSSWGFMSFVLAVVNGVINISNNINNNNNNRNNNNNDNNNNQYNANVGNTNNQQMAGGEAMSGRRLNPLAKLKEIREKYRRKFDTKFNVTSEKIEEKQITGKKETIKDPMIKKEIEGMLQGRP